MFEVPVRGSRFEVPGSKFRHSLAQTPSKFRHTSHLIRAKYASFSRGIAHASRQRMTAKTFRDLRAWQTAYAFKLRIYELIESGPLSNDETLRKQLRESAASAVSQISEGFGRFDPVDFARFVKMARASIVECQNHLQDAVDRGHITNDVRHEYEKLAKDAIAGDRRAARSVSASSGLTSLEQRTPEPRTLNREP